MKAKKLSSGIQIFIGVFSVLIFWLFGMIAGDPLDMFWDTKIEEIIFKIPSFVFSALPFIFAVLIIIFALVGKINGCKKMYWSAFIMTVTPIVTFLISDFVTDSSIISYLLIPVWFLLYPFGIMGLGTVHVVAFNSEIFGYRDEWIFIIIGAGLVISLVLFFTVKRKNKKVDTFITTN